MADLIVTWLESPTPDSALRTAAQAWVNTAAAGKDGRAVHMLKRTARSGILAIERFGTGLALPRDFPAMHLLPADGTDPSRDPISANVRLRQAHALFTHLGVDVEALDWPRFKTPARKKPRAAEIAPAAAEEPPMPDEFAAPATTPTPPVEASSATATLPDPEPEVKGRGKKAVGQGLGWPTGVKVRVLRGNGPGQLPTMLGEWPEEDVARYRSIMTFLTDAIRPTYGPFPGQADITYLVQKVLATGKEGAHVPLVIGAPAAAPTVPPPNSFGYPPLPPPPALAPMPSAGLSPQESVDLALRINSMQSQSAQAAAAGERARFQLTQQPGAIDQMQQFAFARAERLERELAELRMQTAVAQERARFEAQLAEMRQRLAVPTAPTAPPGPSLTDMLALMQKQQENTIALMQSLTPGTDDELKEMRDEVKDLKRHIETAGNTAGLAGLREGLRFLKEVNGDDPDSGALFPKKEQGLGAALLKAMDKVPAMLDSYGALLQRAAAARLGYVEGPAAQQAALPPAPDATVRLPGTQLAADAPEAPPQPADAPPGTPLAPRTAAEEDAERRKAIPANLRASIDVLLAPDTPQERFPEHFFDLFVALAEAAQTDPQLAEVRARIEQRIKAGDDNGLVVSMREVLAFIGYREQATLPKLREIVATLRAEDEDEGDEGDERVATSSPEPAQAAASNGEQAANGEQTAKPSSVMIGRYERPAPLR